MTREAKIFASLVAVATISLALISGKIPYARYDPEYIKRYILQKEVEEEIRRRTTPPPGELKDSPTLADIEANPRYDQEWETEKVWEGDFHFSIDHPKSWWVAVIPPLVRIDRPCKDVCPTFYVTADPKGGLNDPKQYPELKTIFDPKNNYEILEEEYTTIDGHQTYTIRVEHPSISGAKPPVRQRFYYILTENFIYKLEYSEYDNNNDVYLKEEEWVYGDAFNRMVESLKFY